MQFYDAKTGELIAFDEINDGYVNGKISAVKAMNIIN